MIELFSPGGPVNERLDGLSDEETAGDDEQGPMRRRDIGAAVGAAVGHGNPVGVFLGYTIGRALEGKPVLRVTPEPDPGPGRDIGKEAVRNISRAGRALAGKTRQMLARARDRLLRKDGREQAPKDQENKD